MTRDQGAVLSRDALPVRLPDAAGPSDLGLVCDHDAVMGHDGLPLLFVLAPKDVIVAQPRGVADHIEWEAAHGRLESAVSTALEVPRAVKPARLKELIGAYISGLLASAHARKAALACTRLLDDDVDAWNKWVRHMLETCDDQGRAAIVEELPFPKGVDVGAARIVANVPPLPAGAGPSDSALPFPAATARSQCRLSDETYEAALDFLLRADTPAFLRAIRAWVQRRSSAGVSTDDEDAGSESDRRQIAPRVRLGADQARALFQRALAFRNAGGSGGKGNADDMEDVTGALADADAAAAARSGRDPAALGGRASQLQPLYSVARMIPRVSSALLAVRARGATATTAGRPTPATTTAPSVAAAADATSQKELLLSEALAELFALNNQFDRAINVYLEQVPLLRGLRAAGSAPKASPVFDLIPAHSLHALVADKLLQLCELDLHAAVRLAAARPETFPPKNVADQLAARPEWLLAYLHHMFTEESDKFNVPSYKDLHGQLLQLYARLDRPRLLAFLQGSAFYELDVAQQVCAAARPEPLYRELVYVLRRMGNFQEAVALLLGRLNDMPAAVEFAISVDDAALWRELIARAARSGNGAMMGQLLDALPSTSLNPLHVISQIPPSVPIPNLQRRLLVALRDRRVHAGMERRCSEMVRRDFFGLIERLVKVQRAGMLLPAQARCALCNDELTTRRLMASAASGDGIAAGRYAGGRTLERNVPGASVPAAGEDVDGDAGHGDDADGASGGPPQPAAPPPEPAAVVFFCRHVYHDTCLTDFRSKPRALSGRERAGSRASLSSSYSRARGNSFSSVSGSGGGGLSTVGLSGGWVNARGVAIPGGAAGGRRHSRSDRESFVGLVGARNRMRRPSSSAGLSDTLRGAHSSSTAGGIKGMRRAPSGHTYGTTRSRAGSTTSEYMESSERDRASDGWGASREERCPLCAGSSAGPVPAEAL